MAFGIEYVEFLLAIMIAIFSAAYCMAGGYYASIATDKYQNIIGSLALLAIILALNWTGVRKEDWLMFGHQIQFDKISWHTVVGVVTFAFFFNFVDMANWQSMAANRALPKQNIKGIQLGMIKAALIQMVLPAFCGAWLGVTLRSIAPNIQDYQIIGQGIQDLFFNKNWLYALLVGFVVFGFISLTLSASGSFLVAAMQTLSIDVVHRDAVSKFDRADDKEFRHSEEQKILDWVKRYIIIASLISVCVFAGLYYGLRWVGSEAKVFQFQFVMYGSAVTLVPVVISHLIGNRSEISNRPEGIWSIALGLLATLCPFIIAAFFWNTLFVKRLLDVLPFNIDADTIIDLTPLFGLTVSTVTFKLIQRLR